MCIRDRPSRGAVRFDGADVTEHSPQQRNIAQVFQFPVVYDTMTVADNLAFPLRITSVKLELSPTPVDDSATERTIDILSLIHI